MIEKKLLEKGISKEQLIAFAKMPKHNGKEDRFAWIAQTENWNSFGEDNFLFKLTEVLSEIGLKMDEFSPEKNSEQFNYLGESKYKLGVAQKIANRMYGTLRNSKYKQYDETLGLDRIFEDTFAIGGTN